MNQTLHYLKALQPGMDIVAGLSTLSDATLAAFDPATVGELKSLHEVYFGTTKYTRMQARAVAGARAAGHSLEALRIIEKHASRVKGQAEKWHLRQSLCAQRLDCTALEKAARKMRAELNTPVQRKESVTILRRTKGPWTLAIIAASSLVADLHAAIVSADGDPGVLLRGAGNKNLRTNVVIQLDDLIKISRDGANADVTLTRTDGATITGKDLVQSALTSIGLVTLVSRVDGPVDLYRTQRVASTKQRDMISAVYQRCAHPGCNLPVENSQMHHVWAFILGGFTNVANMVPLCPFHNGRNDDHPLVHKNGRLEHRDGQVVWTPPWAEYLTKPPPGMAESY